MPWTNQEWIIVCIVLLSLKRPDSVLLLTLRERAGMRGYQPR